jgi:hypothetical protein
MGSAHPPAPSSPPTRPTVPPAHQAARPALPGPPHATAPGPSPTAPLREPPPPGAAAPAGPAGAFPDTVAPGVRLHPYYGEARNRIVQPDQVRVQTAYFWKKWVPLLGPDLAVLIVQLRNMCYYNPATGERRDWCFPSQATLAAAIGVKNTHTIANLLKRPYAELFVRVEERYRYDPLRRKKVQTTSLYHVRMDDPLTPEDAIRLAAELGATGGARGVEAAGHEAPSNAVSNATPSTSPPVEPAAPGPAGEDLTRKFRVRSGAPDAKFSRQHAREDFASGSARNFRDEEGLLRESIEDGRAAAPPGENPTVLSGTMRTARPAPGPAPPAVSSRGAARHAAAPEQEACPPPAAPEQARARAILQRQAQHTAHRLRGEPALGASGPVRLNAALEEVRRRLFGEGGGRDGP